MATLRVLARRSVDGQEWDLNSHRAPTTARYLAAEVKRAVAWCENTLPRCSPKGKRNVQSEEQLSRAGPVEAARDELGLKVKISTGVDEYP